MRRCGFTLIELLVVIAIIAVLAAILFPVFARAREKARQTSCASNERQLLVAVQMYAQDYDEQLPFWYQWGTGGSIYYWWETLQPYVKSKQVLICPSGATDPAKFGGTVGWLVVTHYVPLWYAQGLYANPVGGLDAFGGGCINAQYAGATPWYWPYGLARCKNPSGATWLIEGYGLQDPNNANASVAGFGDFLAPAENYRHNDGWNVAFLDGHVKWMRGTSFWGSTVPDSSVSSPPGRRYAYWSGIF